MGNFLPKKFKKSYDYCFFLHDQLVETMRLGEQARIFEAQIKIKDPAQIKAIGGLTGEKLVEWLLANGYRREVFFMEYKQIVAALLSDFLHFIYEALTCSRKGKLTVSYALLRKPLKEKLFYLEWLLAEPSELLSRFDGGLVEELGVRKGAPTRREDSHHSRGAWPYCPEGVDRRRFPLSASIR